MGGGVGGARRRVNINFQMGKGLLGVHVEVVG